MAAKGKSGKPAAGKKKSPLVPLLFLAALGAFIWFAGRGVKGQAGVQKTPSESSQQPIEREQSGPGRAISSAKTAAAASSTDGLSKRDRDQLNDLLEKVP